MHSMPVKIMVNVVVGVWAVALEVHGLYGAFKRSRAGTLFTFDD